MATDVIATGDEEPATSKPPAPAAQQADGGGFFHIYKKGQGYWTRMGTAVGAAS